MYIIYIIHKNYLVLKLISRQWCLHKAQTELTY